MSVYVKVTVGNCSFTRCMRGVETTQLTNTCKGQQVMFMGTHCENCKKLPRSLLEFNSVLLCTECFEKEIKRITSAVIEP